MNEIRVQRRSNSRRTCAMSANVLAVVLAVASGCSTTIPSPNLGRLYNRAAMEHHENRNPVVMIPGILGSRLAQKETGRIVWGAFAPGYANPKTPDGAALFALPMREGAALSDLTDDVEPVGALDSVRVHLLGLPVELSAYSQILGTLGVGGYRDEPLALEGEVDYGTDHYTCFQFPYDWRRDLVESARDLDAFLKQKRDFVQAKLDQEYGKKKRNIRFDIVAHSMGGLVARYYLRFGTEDLPKDGSLPPVTWAGAEMIENVIIVGTPSAGSVKAFDQLVSGAVVAPILPKYEPAVLVTMPSIFELMPRARHQPVRGPNGPIDHFDPTHWIRNRWGALHPSQDKYLKWLLGDKTTREERVRIVEDQLRKCLARAEHFHAAMDQPVVRPPHLKMYLFAGDAAETPAVAAFDEKGTAKISEYDLGDGTVLRSSALLDERIGSDWQPNLLTPIDWSAATFLFADHLGMTKEKMFSDNLLYLLLEAP